VGDEDEYTLEKSIMKGNRSFGGRTARLPEVVAAKERRNRRKERRKKERTGTRTVICPEGHQPR
jgi:hypothetical protein